MDFRPSMPQPAASAHAHTHRDAVPRSMPVDHEANTCHIHSHLAFVAQSPWPKKLDWISQRLSRARDHIVRPHSSRGQSATAARSSPPSDPSSNSLPLTRPSHRMRRRGPWVREPVRKRHAPNHTRNSYKKAFADRTVRKHLISSLVLGLLLVTLVSIYLAYTLTIATLEGQEFHILIIVFIILVAMFFCHSLARTCMLATRVARYGTTCHRVPSVAGPQGYAQPPQPIHVILARDEEIVGQESGPSQITITAPPPAYGLWRNSVRIDPNLIRWQKVEAIKPAETGLDDSSCPSNPNRPPSYISDNGVDYVIEAQPRSTVSPRNECRV